MDYKIIVLGATFLGAGICSVYGDDCLLIDSRLGVGYEFIKALNFGADYEKELISDEAKSLREVFCKKDALKDGRVCLLPCAFAMHSAVDGKNVMLNMKIISVEKKDNFYEVSAYGVSGFRTYRAQRVIDTRAFSEDSVSKTMNVLVTGDKAVRLDLDGYITEKSWGYSGDVVVKCPLDKNDDFVKARRSIENLARNMTDGCKIVLTADEFDYKFDAETIYERDGIVHMVSASFPNPLLAFDAGAVYAKEGVEV